MPVFRDESNRCASLCGVPGHFEAVTTKPGKAPGLWFQQKWWSEWRPTNRFSERAVIRAEVRFDDGCGNGYNSFAVTATIKQSDSGGQPLPGERAYIAGGCCHDDVVHAFPELAHLIKWHLFDTRGPMHYVANTLYHAGDRDHWGLRKGEASKSPRHQETAVRFGDNPILHKLNQKFAAFLQERHAGDPTAPGFNVIPIAYQKKPGGGTDYKFGPKYTFVGFGETWYDCPFDNEQEALNFAEALAKCKPQFVTRPTLFGEGKARELNHARSAAVWPEVTDAELIAWSDDGSLKQRLLDRLPAMLAAFEGDVRAAGLWWSPEEHKAVA